MVNEVVREIESALMRCHYLARKYFHWFLKTSLMADRFGISSSKDIVKRSIDKDVFLPADARHGSVSRLTKEEAQTLLMRFPGNKR